ncbi:hypothetical protein [Kribbella italica]|uniref:Uncharacterized protein n=1 Tax=Kribbella italica TaxID=1540520 RepID=A0A7W9MW73_9ACTN|nr:hypothetical protein [Kribbella italica]MBB5837753.1 hypothetical protein [Kribbella italica]
MTAPTVTDADNYLGDTSYTTEELGKAFAAEKKAQAKVCRVPADDAEWDEDLSEALFRRVARNLAMRGIPLAILQGDADLGTVGARLPGRDPEVRRLEAPWRKLVMG